MTFRMFLAGVALSLLQVPAAAREEGEVRQIVTFDLEEGAMAEAVRLFRERALPLYAANEPMLRFRAYREVESPVSLDLVVVSSFRGMAGMEASNRALAAEAKKQGTTLASLYGEIGALSSGHWDQFVSMDPSLAWGNLDGAELVVLVSVRLLPGSMEGYRALLRDELVPWEEKSAILGGSESGSYLLSDGYTFFRILGLSRLGDWQLYLSSLSKQPFSRELDRLTVAARQIVLAPVRELSVH
jgi:hypothetical protein